MDPSAPSTCTRLEDLPNEIFLAILEYIPLHELYRAFHGLTDRVNKILQAVNHLSLTLNRTSDIKDEAVAFFASQIYHVNVLHSRRVDFSRLPSLRSFKSMFPGDQQLRCVRAKDLPNLTHLKLGFGCTYGDELITRLCKGIFSNQFPNLRFCSLWPPTLDDDQPETKTPTLTHVQLGESNFEELCVIVKACPNLEHVQVSDHRCLLHSSRTCLSSDVGLFVR